MITKKVQNQDQYKREWVCRDAAGVAWVEIIEAEFLIQLKNQD